MPSIHFPIDEAYLIGGWLESALWGFYTLLFGLSIHTIYQKRRERILRFTTISVILLYVLATIHLVLAVVRLINAFVRYRDTVGPVEYLANIAVPLNVAKDWFYVTNLFLGDLVVVWRLYVVWGQNQWIAAFPIICVVAELIAGYGATLQWVLPNPVLESTVQWGTAMFSMSMATNIAVTAATAGRIWYLTLRPKREGSMHSPIHYNRLILLLVESGALITTAKIIEFALFNVAPGDGLNGNNAMYIVFEAMPQITGIAPTLIIYVVNNGYIQDDNWYTANSGSTLLFTRTDGGEVRDGKTASTNSTANVGNT
ncbi:hypothetical protein C8Q74DRAFT_1363912 [Fomes fomentarius]|nr:hypothetical protein C8Q74DRAFT_1363912 [Fomes fomentarius]